MKKLKLVIKGAYYYDRENDIILVPHFTGEFIMVDCDRFERMKDLKGRYDNTYIDHVRNYSIRFENKQYYYAEYSPETIGDWELLSDLSNLEYLEEDFNF